MSEIKPDKYIFRDTNPTFLNRMWRTTPGYLLGGAEERDRIRAWVEKQKKDPNNGSIYRRVLDSLLAYLDSQEGNHE